MEKITITLTKEETLVLYNLCYRVSENVACFEHKAEQMVLWSIEAQLDKLLIEPFNADYLNTIENAKEHIVKTK
ncbi:hypothetical protein G7062_09720 [Erysipelothrix sp. HDW6C]|uniref:hypothetical protein n=1 Tax=Erysipelothrix sp. HDW6C TaxID=2714930 RepID=UPI00140899C7|nr:hypothetical protein [Erysipelothrix sp. HDW6C]QIK70561.1 hypothetical protein G7062_09720 [Erysipelothrix sp. HDW6C]